MIIKILLCLFSKAIVLLKRDSFVEAGTGQHKEIFFKIIEKIRVVRTKMWKTFHESLYENWWYCWKKNWQSINRQYNLIIKSSTYSTTILSIRRSYWRRRTCCSASVTSHWKMEKTLLQWWSRAQLWRSRSDATILRTSTPRCSTFWRRRSACV